jgi:hypothetical protein
VLSSAVAVLLGLLLYIVFCLDHPFGSQLGVTSEPFEHSLEVFDAGYVPPSGVNRACVSREALRSSLGRESRCGGNVLVGFVGIGQ